MTYEEYIASPAWRATRDLALARDGHRCRGCDTTENLEVHHRRYPAVLGEETVDDLTTLCGGSDGCHAAITSLIRGRRYAGRTVTVLDSERVGPYGQGGAEGISAIEVPAAQRVGPRHAFRQACGPAQPDRQSGEKGVVQKDED